MVHTAAERKHSVLVFALAMLTTLEGCGGGATSQPPQQAAILAETVDGMVQTQMQQYGIPGMVVALAKNGSMLYVQGYGVTNLMTNSKTPTNTIYEIGSITKQFTAALIMKLQEQGKLHVDNLTATYLPQYNFPSTITIRMCLTHTSGLANYTDFPQIGEWLNQGVSEVTV